MIRIYIDRLTEIQQWYAEQMVPIIVSKSLDPPSSQITSNHRLTDFYQNLQLISSDVIRDILLNSVDVLHTPLKKCSLTADDGASPPLKWCTNSAEMVHGGRRRGAWGRHAGNHSGMPLRLRMDSPSIWMV